ncbi:PhzF family phenazine biosynthesis protein [Nocardia flavorosea]|uniref:PhzF family phenazine biosynthesis protein n=1 Tax=Nocardia flavorosea TaxID=53429 RepID=A0A846YD98_9NOCA|nr:PhzF family phenazine biosynthesis protein [Nocardia flavorosea]NKY56847.1 PhzF family phenazine biosynthesis protein [Nocardia flavorosea]
MIDHDVLSVFCGPAGDFGNELGVVQSPDIASDAERLAIARDLGFSETVFVDDPVRATVDIWTPSVRLPFAGHPCVGAAWLLDTSELETAAGLVTARRDGEITWIAARAEWVPHRTLKQYDSAEQVNDLGIPPPGEWIYAWAWQDEAAHQVRARAFPGRGDGIDEDEATGAAALLLTATLGRGLTITQGRGSQILTYPKPDGSIEIGGRVRRIATFDSRTI